VRKYVTHVDFVFHSHNEVQTTWMEGHCQTLFREDLADLMCLGHVIPNVDSLVLRACDN